MIFIICNFLFSVKLLKKIISFLKKTFLLIFIQIIKKVSVRSNKQFIYKYSVFSRFSCTCFLRINYIFYTLVIINIFIIFQIIIFMSTFFINFIICFTLTFSLVVNLNTFIVVIFYFLHSIDCFIH